jgi:tetratricopeptide (TPR) repeat protein
MWKDYQRALEDFNKVNVLEPNNAIILRRCGNVKRMLTDYQGTLEDLDKVDFLEHKLEFK